MKSSHETLIESKRFVPRAKNCSPLRLCVLCGSIGLLERRHQPRQDGNVSRNPRISRVHKRAVEPPVKHVLSYPIGCCACHLVLVPPVQDRSRRAPASSEYEPFGNMESRNGLQRRVEIPMLLRALRPPSADGCSRLAAGADCAAGARRAAPAGESCRRRRRPRAGRDRTPANARFRIGRDRARGGRPRASLRRRLFRFGHRFRHVLPRRRRSLRRTRGVE